MKFLLWFGFFVFFFPPPKAESSIDYRLAVVQVQKLTEVVYFDVWSDCVVGWSLAGVVVRLGN